MHLSVVRMSEQGRKLTERELRNAADTIKIEETGTGYLMEAQLTGISQVSLGLEGYEEASTPSGIVFHWQE